MTTGASATSRLADVNRARIASGDQVPDRLPIHPGAPIAMSVTPARASQSPSATRSAVMVPNVRASLAGTAPGPDTRTQAVLHRPLQRRATGRYRMVDGRMRNSARYLATVRRAMR